MTVDAPIVDVNVKNTGLFGKELDLEARKKLGFVGFDGKDAEFCPYTDTSENYDKTRVPLGLPITLGYLGSEGLLEEQSLLDVGSGTGTFLAKVHSRFDRCVGLEYNDGMIKQASKRFKDVENVSYQQGSADALPFADGSFHAASMNQVSHHFPTCDDYAFLAKVLCEIYRVLKPGGKFVMNHATREQTRGGLWWTALMPKTTEQYCLQTCPTDLLLKYMVEAGFEVGSESCVVPVMGTLMAEDVYLKKYGIDGAFEKEYQDGDSSWVMCETIGELPEVHEKIRAMKNDGTSAKFLEERETLRKHVGQATFICVRKPL